MKLAWKEIRYNWKKYLLIELLLVLMIFMVMFLSGLANSLGRAVSAGIENMDASYFIVSEDAENIITMSNLDPDILQQIEMESDGSVAALNIQRLYLNRQGESEKLDIAYFAISPEGFLNPKVTQGSPLTEAEHTIVMDDSFEEEGAAIGNILVDSSSGIELTVVGFTKDAMYGHVPVGFISTDTYTDIRTAVNPGGQKQYHAIALQNPLPDDIMIKGITAADKEAIIKNIPGYQAEQMTIRMILWVLVVVSAAILGVFFYIITIQKRKQFGVLKAIGIGMREICAFQFSQVLFIACCGVFFGTLLTLGMSYVLPKSMPFYFNQSDAFIASSSFVLISMFSSLISTRIIANVDPVTIIAGNEE